MSCQAAVVLLVLVCTGCCSAQPTTATPRDTLPLTYPSKVVNATGQVCPASDVLINQRDEIVQEVRDLIRNTIAITPPCQAFQVPANPAAACSALPTTCPSDYYWVMSSNGSAVQVYCSMDGACGCNITGGWTRVANLNMSDPSEQCPGDWTQRSLGLGLRLCGRGGSSCFSAMFNTYNINYTRVCGRVIAYQYSSTDAFVGTSIESHYVDGVSLTHGLPGERQHIWTFACGLQETRNPGYPANSCPCVSETVVPSFIGDDYYCESGNPGPSFTGVLYDDPLWDGQGCGAPPCCELNDPPGAPWFCKQLAQPTTDNIEARICSNQSPSNEDTPISLIELYIQWGTTKPLSLLASLAFWHSCTTHEYMLFDFQTWLQMTCTLHNHTRMSSQWELYVQVINVSVNYTKVPVQNFVMKSARIQSPYFRVSHAYIYIYI